MFGIFKRKNKNKDIDPVKEKQKLVNVISSLSSMQGSILPANNVLISR